MRNELLFRESYIAIEYNQSDDWIYVNWRGFVNYETVTTGCEKILFFMKDLGCTKVLNDNTNVEGIWSGASKWVGQDWFPRMAEAGMLYFAWVHSSSAFSRLSTEKALKNTADLRSIQTFDNIEAARDWLRSV
ncbi:hypothetical protein [Pontibacter beigongshangensis]|uniref:hypothetical protein n=1 Tax=Pontibacter beigongshangensis TaxID=2574733 RepID=UPI00164FA0BE|nr:hypothetical protein [Pontibacter beigongshangensis]